MYTNLISNLSECLSKNFIKMCLTRKLRLRLWNYFRILIRLQNTLQYSCTLSTYREFYFLMSKRTKLHYWLETLLCLKLSFFRKGQRYECMTSYALNRFNFIWGKSKTKTLCKEFVVEMELRANRTWNRPWK